MPSTLAGADGANKLNHLSGDLPCHSAVIVVFLLLRARVSPPPPIVPTAAALRRGERVCQRVHVAGKCHRVCIIHYLSVIVRLSGCDSRRRARVRAPAAVRTCCIQVVCMCQRKLLTLSRNGGTHAYRAGSSCCPSLATCKTGVHLCIWVTCLHKTEVATRTGRLVLSDVYARSPGDGWLRVSTLAPHINACV